MIARVVLVLTVLAVLGTAGGCKKDSSNPAAPPAPGPASTAVTVTIANFAFSPSTLTVAKGTTVTWKNTDGAAHTATSDAGAFDTGSLATGASGSFTFSAAGTFPYHCTFHTHMVASVTVQ